MVKQPRPKGWAFPLKVSYETSLLTLITFLISIASLVWQIVNYFEGPQVRLIAADQITIGSSGAVKFPNRDGGPFVHFIAQMSYVNSASSGYNATIRVERIRITIGGQKPFEYRWYRFVSRDADGADGSQLVVNKISEAHPFPVTAGSSQSRETLFQPWQKDCAATDNSCQWDENYIDWTAFIDRFGKTRTAEFEFIAEIYGQKPTSATCIVTMSEERFADLKSRKWGSPVCVPKS